MRQDRGPSLIRYLLSDHHVYVRSGPTSRYVVLSWPWQVGVSLAVVALVGWAGVASFAWFAEHLETLGQRRELARLTEINQRLEASAEAARAAVQQNAMPEHVARLVAQLADLEAGRERALSLADAAAGEADELRRELALAAERIRELEAEGSAHTVPATLNLGRGTHDPDGVDGAADDALAEQLRTATTRVEQLSVERDRLRGRVAQQTAEDRAHAAETGQLRAELRSAHAEIARLRSALSAAQGVRQTTNATLEAAGGAQR
jgi:uncharacterized coiled-coil DUF342 family protein